MASDGSPARVKSLVHPTGSPPSPFVSILDGMLGSVANGLGCQTLGCTRHQMVSVYVQLFAEHLRTAMKSHKAIISISLAVLATLPGIYLRFAHVHLDPLPTALFAGLAILGAAFLVLWACEVIQLDVSQTLALALVALIAVLPEYAVDMYFTWMAGQEHDEVYSLLLAGQTPPQDMYAHYAIANMTGANRLLIGIGWPVIVVIVWFKMRSSILLEKERSTELVFLFAATLYAFLIPIKGTLAWYDCIVFIALFVWYIIIASKRPSEECELEGPAEFIGNMPTVARRFTTWMMFLFAAAVIVLNAEPFSEGLVATGEVFGINKFLLVQWVAPLASEAPEFTVAILMALRGKPGMALGALLSSKLNQWTLLVGMIPGAYAISSQQIALPIPMDTLQMHEILLTAAQSILGVALLSDFRLSFREGILLLVLFLGQFFMSPWIDSLHNQGLVDITGDHVHLAFSVVYVAIAVYFFLRYPSRIRQMLEGFKLVPGKYHPHLEDTRAEMKNNNDR